MMGLCLHFAPFKVSILLDIKVVINDLTDVDLIPLARAANSLRGWQLSSYNGLSLLCTILKIITSLCVIVKIFPSLYAIVKIILSLYTIVKIIKID